MRLCLLIFTVLIIISAPPLTQATPREIILYPAAALITESGKRPIIITESGRIAEFTLPAAAIPQSLKVALAPDGKFNITDISIKRQTIAHDRPLQELKRRSEALAEEKIRLRASLAALDAQILFWQTQAKGRAKNSQEASNLSQVITRNSRKAHQERMSLERESKVNASRIADIQKEIERRENESISNWQVAVHVSGPPQKELTLTWTYLTRDCGWRPYYRINAFLADRRMEVTSGVLVWQRTDQDWNQALLTLAHGDPTGSYSAIGPAPLKVAPGRKAVATTPMTLDSGEKHPRLIEGQDKIQKKTPLNWFDGRLVPLGARNIPSRKKIMLPLTEENWPANFTHRIGPERPNEPNLVGVFHPPDLRSSPSGETDLLVEGTWWRRVDLSFSGRPVEIDFGADPLVVVSNSFLTGRADPVVDGDKAAAVEQGRRVTSVTNRRKAIIRLELRENRPRTDGEEATGEAIFSPPPDHQSAKEVIWTRDILPGQEMSFTWRLITK